MKRIATLIAGALVAALGANAQILWKVEGNNLDKPSYILGSHHVAPADMLSRINGFKEALDGVEAVYGEINMADMNPMEMQQKMMAHIMAPADSTLSKLLTPAQLDSIGALIGNYMGQPLDMAQLEPMKPVMVSTQIALLESMKAFPGFNPAAQLDATVQNMGKAAGKKVDGLETLEFQMGVLYDNPLREQADDLMDVVRNDSTNVEKAGQLANAYVAGDLAKIDSLMKDDEDMTPEKLEKLLLSRNRDWAGKLPAIMKEQPTMIVVGCGHLPGKEGVLELLRAQGYTLTPVDK